MSEITDLFIVAWMILVITYFCSASLFLKFFSDAKNDKQRQRIMMLIVVMFTFLALSRLTHLIAVLSHGDFIVDDFSIENKLLFNLSQVFLYGALIAILYSFEKKIKQEERKYYTLISILIAITYFSIHQVYMFQEENEILHFFDMISSYALSGTMTIFGLYLAFMYLKISIKTSGTLKRKAFLIFIGFMLMIGSYAVFVLEDLFVDAYLIAGISFTFSFISLPFLILGYSRQNAQNA